MKILVVAGVALTIAIAWAGVAGTVIYLSAIESATVNITLSAWPLNSFTEVHGAPTGGDFPTKRTLVTLTETVTGAATGSVLVGGGQYATGYVVLNHYCVLPGMTCPAPTPAMAGYLVCQAPNPGRLNICYFLQAGASCYCGERVPIRAVGPGSGSNLPANRVTAPAWPEPYGTAVTVNNPVPITGGTDGTPSPAVSQSDIDAAYASARTQLSIDLQSALLVKSGGLIHVIPDGAPQMTVTSNVAAGARTKTFQVTATGTLGATEFQDSDALAVMATGIDRWVPSGYRLNGAPVVTQYKIESWTEEGDVTISGEAIDSVLPKFSTDTLRSRLRGARVDGARAMIETVAPLSQVEIKLTPAPAPILPLDSSRITIAVTVRPAPVP